MGKSDKEQKIDYFKLVANTGSAPNSRFSQLSGLERAKVAAEISKHVKEMSQQDRLDEIIQKTNDQELKQKISNLTPERRAKLVYLMNSGVINYES